MPKLHVTSRVEKVDGEWFCIIDWGEIVSELGTMNIEKVTPLHIGPFKSQKEAKRQLTGDIRKILLKTVNENLIKKGGRYEHFKIGDE